MMHIGLPTGRHCGCRLTHEVAAGAALLRFRAGDTPSEPVRDEPVQFMLTGPEIDDLVEQLKKIRSEVDDSAAHFNLAEEKNHG